MIAAIFFFIATISLIVGHLLKIHRWKLFIDIYEKPNQKSLVASLSWGYLINAFIPFHIGDLVRAFIAGKKMKNGISFSLATVIVDRFLDVLVVALIFITLYLLGFNSEIILSSISLYAILVSLIVLFCLFAVKYSNFIKKIIKKISSIFNNSIELKILKTTWFTINTFKDIFHKINKFELAISTIMMWLMYLVSYATFALALNNRGYNVELVDVLISLFATGNLESSTVGMIQNLTSIGTITMLYLIVPVLLMIIYSWFLKSSKDLKNDRNYINLIPHINENDRLAFLEAYFEGNNREYFQNYLKINSDISIIQDFSAGSNATTMLCTNNDIMFYRKYAFGSAGEKLYDQVKWINDHSNNLVLTDILEVKKGEGYCCYDMPYLKEGIGCFNYVHSSDIDNSWNLLKKVLDDLEKNLYINTKRKSSKSLVDKYIDSKVIQNLEIINNAKEVKELSKYENLIINGKKYKNAQYFQKYLTPEYLKEIFKDDYYSDIHGDLTIENIICIQNSKNKNDYYIIDPNTGNVHDSPNLDYAKLLQSLHGGYEFLMHTKNVEVQENKINFMNARTTVYDELFKRYKDYLENKFGIERAKSIFYHEIIHWLRLLPYKINKDRDRFIMFYAGYIIVLNEVIEYYEK